MKLRVTHESNRRYKYKNAAKMYKCIFTISLLRAHCITSALNNRKYPSTRPRTYIDDAGQEVNGRCLGPQMTSAVHATRGTDLGAKRKREKKQSQEERTEKKKTTNKCILSKNQQRFLVIFTQTYTEKASQNSHPDTSVHGSFTFTLDMSLSIHAH